ncbi:hypothetical protein FS837_000607, partial [Tulasnella sp. UAMH 9824]
MPPIIVRVASPPQPRPVIIGQAMRVPAAQTAPSPRRRQQSIHVQLRPEPRPPGPFFMNVVVMVDPPPRPPQRIIVEYADQRTDRRQSPVRESPIQVTPPQITRTIDISPGASPMSIHSDLPVGGLMAPSNGSLRRKESARSRTGALPVVVEMPRPVTGSGIAISQDVLLERPRSWVPPPPLVERVEPT